MSVRIRLATPEDVTALAEIEQESFSKPHWEASSFLRYECIVAEFEGRVAGFLVAREVFPGKAGAAAAEREILNLAVDPVYRRLGIATALLRYELASYATHFLEVRESNKGALELYRKMGFTEIGRRENYYDFPSETAIVMRMK